MKRAVWFTIGTAAGIYINQNYDVPNIQSTIREGYSWVKEKEEELKKSSDEKNK